jgi:hypothetical protein
MTRYTALIDGWITYAECIDDMRTIAFDADDDHSAWRKAKNLADNMPVDRDVCDCWVVIAVVRGETQVVPVPED